MSDRRFVITGSGRCGTKWTSEALTAAGVPTGHELVFGPEVRPWNPEVPGEVSWMASARMDLVDVPVALLVRHPMDVVRSWAEIGFFTWDLGNPTHEPLHAAWPGVYAWSSPADMALDMWVRTTEAGLRRAELVLRWEGLDASLFGRLLSWCGGDPGAAEVASATPRCNRHEESRERTNVTHVGGWSVHDPTLAQRAHALAVSLGYRQGDPEQEGVHGLRLW